MNPIREEEVYRDMYQKIAVETTRKQSNITDAGVALHVDRFVSLQDSSWSPRQRMLLCTIACATACD
jgi:hypothetical protein